MLQERKKLRRQRKQEKQQEEQEKIRLGLMDAPAPRGAYPYFSMHTQPHYITPYPPFCASSPRHARPDNAPLPLPSERRCPWVTYTADARAIVTVSNLMRVLGNDAIQEPTRVEQAVRQAGADRQQAHMSANEGTALTGPRGFRPHAQWTDPHNMATCLCVCACMCAYVRVWVCGCGWVWASCTARKLTAEQKREKVLKRLAEDRATDTLVAVFRVADLSHPQRRFKVSRNAQQMGLSGVALAFSGVSAVIVEGGP
jgi:hypothetical protein